MRLNFNDRFWDERRGLYLDYNLRSGKPIPVNTAMTFLPLFAGLATPEQARRLIDAHWLNPAEYATGAGLQYCLTSVSRDEPTWEPRRYWRGPIWINLNWLVAEGLRRYGYIDLAQRLYHDSLELLRRSGFREYYDPRDGSGCGSMDFSWSAALALELSATYGTNEDVN
jgi:neutral trehalase